MNMVVDVYRAAFRVHEEGNATILCIISVIEMHLHVARCMCIVSVCYMCTFT